MPLAHLLRVLGLLALFASPAAALPKEITGRVRIVRPDGIVESQSDGFAMLRVRQDSTAKAQDLRVAITEGRWKAEIPKGVQWQVRVVRIEEGDCFPLAEGRWMPVPVTGRFDLDVRVLRSFLLKVYAPDGRTELKDVTVLRKLSRDARLPHPDPASSKTSMVTGPSASPIDIQVRTPDKYTYFAKAPGHAWGRVEVDPFLGGVATLQLEPGGDLEIELNQRGSERGKVFRVRRHVTGGKQLFLELKRYGTKVHLDALPEGTYSISSEEPIRPDNMPVYGTAEVKVVQGRTVQQVLVLKPNPTFFPAPVAGKLFVSEAWGNVDDLVIVLKRIDRYGVEGRYYEVDGSELEEVPGQDRAYSWRIDQVMPGAFDLQIRPLSYHVFREVFGGGNLRLDLQLPEPRTVELLVVDGDTGEAADVNELSWMGLSPEVTRSKIKNLPDIECEEVKAFADTPGSFRFQAPQQPLRLVLNHPNYLRAEANLDATTAVGRPWRLRRATGLRLRLLRNGQVVEWKGDAAVTPKGGKGQVIGSRSFGDARQYDLSAPGEYVVELPPIPGYGRVPARTIQITSRQVLQFDVQLDD